MTLDTLDMTGVTEDEAYLFGFAALDELDELADEAFRRSATMLRVALWD